MCIISPCKLKVQHICQVDSILVGLCSQSESLELKGRCLSSGGRKAFWNAGEGGKGGQYRIMCLGDLWSLTYCIWQKMDLMACGIQRLGSGGYGMEQAQLSVTDTGVLRWISNNVFVSPVWTLWECLCCVCASLQILGECCQKHLHYHSLLADYFQGTRLCQ